MIVMKETATDDEVDAVVAKIERAGALAHRSRGARVTVIGAIGDVEQDASVESLGLEGQPGVECIEMHYPLIHECNQRPYHFLHGYPQYLEQLLGVKIPLTRFSWDIHLAPEERSSPPPGADVGIGEHFWIIGADAYALAQ